LQCAEGLKDAFVTLPGLMVIPRVTREYLENAVRVLWTRRDEFFDRLARIKSSN
jgi:hypothetical protein